MPYVLELVTKHELTLEWTSNNPVGVEGENLDGIYRIVRNCHLPELFSFPSRFKAGNNALKAQLATLKAKTQIRSKR